MRKPNVKLVAAAGIFLAGLIIGFLITRNNVPETVNTNQQTSDTSDRSTEQKNETTVKDQEELFMQPDINNQEFILSGSTVNCSTSEVNGVKSYSCSGNIRIIPTANESNEQGLYKINERTRLLHDGQEQDLNTLQQLSQNRAKVRLTLADGSDEMLKEIRY